MASSSGPIDAVEQRSFWAVNVEHTLRIMREELDNEVVNEFRILKVPEYDRRPTVVYSPVEWRFGLHNRDENQDAMSESEAAKRAVVVLFGLDEQLKWTTFCDAVVPDPRAMLKCYGLHKVMDGLLEAEIKQVLAFDALSLAVCVEVESDMAWESMKLVSKKLWDSDRRWMYFNHSFELFCSSVILDICKIENQIPFDLIKNAINHVLKLTNPRQTQDSASCTYTKAEQVSDEYLEMWMKAAVKLGMYQLMDISDDYYEGANATMILSESHHILGALHKVICGVVGLQRRPDFSQKAYIHVPSATRLKESGIRIEAVAGPMCVMSYNKATSYLSMPKMELYDNTVSLVRNMARYEEYLEGRKYCMFHDYVCLMLDLIQTPSDLDYLVKCGVINNGCGNKAVHVWGALQEGLRIIPSSEEHNKMKSDINERCKLRRHRLWSEFKTLFLSRPWLTLSTIAITVVTLATLIQTYSAVISSNGMKPQFNP